MIKRKNGDVIYQRETDRQEAYHKMEILQDGLVVVENEGESVYMIDGVVVREIQIKGKNKQYLMDPQGRIYDMQGKFIGTANDEGLKVMGIDQNES